MESFASLPDREDALAAVEQSVLERSPPRGQPRGKLDADYRQRDISSLLRASWRRWGAARHHPKSADGVSITRKGNSYIDCGSIAA